MDATFIYCLIAFIFGLVNIMFSLYVIKNMDK